MGCKRKFSSVEEYKEYRKINNLSAKKSRLKKKLEYEKIREENELLKHEIKLLNDKIKFLNDKLEFYDIQDIKHSNEEIDELNIFLD